MPLNKVHPTARLSFLVRVSMLPCLGVVIFATFLSTGRITPWLIVLVVAHVLLWPHLAWLHARMSRNSKRAEQWNLLVESLISGAWMAGMQFSLWPSVLLFLGVNQANICNGGVRFGLRGLLAMLVGVLAVAWTIGFQPQFQTAPLPTALSIGAFFAYFSMFALQTYVASRRLVRSQRELRERNLQIQEKSVQLAQARDDADAANRSKSMFLANMSHELRTPLNAIIGYSELLTEEAEDAGDTSLVPDLEKIRTAGKHLLGLINQVLDLSKIEAGKMELSNEEVDVASLIADVRTTVEPLVHKKGNTLVVESDAPGRMLVDVTKLRQVLFNLLGNASKFTENGNVHLRVRREARQARPWLVFEIEDTGIGMTPEQQQRVFEPFAQADASTSRKYGGTGLGLALSRHFTEMMGGDVAMTSTAGVGTKFIVSLPAEPEATASLEATQGRPLDAGAAHATIVLIVDDDQDGAELIGRIVTREGYRVATAQNGEEGLRLARELRPDLILLDVLMPSVDGWSVLARLKDDRELETIPVVMISAVNGRQFAVALGAVDYLVKPVDAKILAQALHKHLGDEQAAPLLIIDDDATTRSMLHRALERQGRRVIEAVDGNDGLAQLDKQRPSAILLDLMMPKMDGFAFLHALSERGPESTPPVIVLTAKTLSQAERAQLKGHVQEVVEKGSFSHQQLERLIRSAMDARKARAAT